MCFYIATASIKTEMAKGKTIAEAKKITWQEATDELGGLPPVKRHCSVLAVEGLRSAIRDYEEKHGLISEQEPTTDEVVRSRLKHVMNPMAGLDIVRTELVTKIEVKDGAVRVILDLPSSHQFANAIKEDLLEKLEALWDVKEVQGFSPKAKNKNTYRYL